MTDLATTEARDTDQLKTDLAQINLRALASPLPKDPGALGWQMTAAGLSALSLHLLHHLQKTEPAKAAAITEWFDGPLGEGPNLFGFGHWIEKHVTQPAGADFQQWIDEARDAAQESAAYVASRQTTAA